MDENVPAVDHFILDEVQRIREDLDWLGAEQHENNWQVMAQDIWHKAQISNSLKLRRPQLGTTLRLLRQVSQKYQSKVIHHDVGTVQYIGNGVAALSGLRQVCVDELVSFSTGVQGLVMTLDRELVHAILLGSDEDVHGGDLVVATGRRLMIPVGEDLIGRVINPLGQPIDGLGAIEPSDFYLFERPAPGIVERTPVNQPLHTGLKTIDVLFPIGRGQRELIIGDRQTGKTSIAIDTILSQAGSNVQCIYVAIGQKRSSILSVIDTLKKAGAMEYTTVIVSSPDDPPALRYLAPYAGCSIAEFLTHQLGHDTLVIYDDLNRHADSYRELSLLLRRPPGREAYPGDIFYIHARLLERACKLSGEAGGGSLSALPVVELQRGNISAYIPTNLISITDGQIVLNSDLFNRGIKPAVDIGRSVSRVGGAAQTPAMRRVAGDIRLELAQYEEVAQFARFGTDLDQATQQQIRSGQRMQRLLTQAVHQPVGLARQVIVLYAAGSGRFDRVEADEVRAYEARLLDYFEEQHAGILNDIERGGDIHEKIEAALEAALDEFDDILERQETEG